MNIYKESLIMHEEKLGKLDIVSKVPTDDEHDLALAYTPGVAEPCRAIAKDLSSINRYTSRGNTIAVVSDGSAVLGLGNIGARASLPVMEGKCVLFRNFGGVAAFPICIDSQNVDTIVNTVKLLEPSFSGINLEDISAPRCFEIEDRLKAETKMLIFHDDQHGTAIITLAGLFNALKIVNKDIGNIKIVINGAGAAGTAISKLLLYIGVTNIIVCDSKGILQPDRNDLNFAKKELASITNSDKIYGNLNNAIENADVFIGVSVAGALTESMIAKMANNPIVFAMANPEPEILPDLARKCGVRVIATGRSDFPNQVNNVLAFPGIFRGALDVKATEINMEMKLASSKALAGIITDNLNPDYIIPKPFDKRVLPAIVAAVAKAAVDSGCAPPGIDLDLVEFKAKNIIKR